MDRSQARICSDDTPLRKSCSEPRILSAGVDRNSGNEDAQPCPASSRVGYRVPSSTAARVAARLGRSWVTQWNLSLIHISEPTRLGMISYAVFCLKKKKR